MIWSASSALLSRDPIIRRADHIKLWFFCLSVPVLYALTLLVLDVPIASNAFETTKYSWISIDWLENGFFLKSDEQPGADNLNTARLPVYPFFLAVMFSLFGRENYAMVLVAQTIMAAGSIYLTALAARELNRNWTWLAAVLAALTINIAYRGTLALPDILLTFLVAGFTYCGLKAFSSERVVTWLFTLGLVGIAALLTRPVFQFVWVLVLPVFIVALAVLRSVGYRRAALMGLIPAALMAAAYGAQVLKIQVISGHATFTTQTGQHALYWLMPCLAQPYGCGNRSVAKIDEAKLRLARSLEAVDPQQRENRVIVDQHRRALAREMLFELSSAELIRAAIASMLKMMFHSGIYEIYERTGVQATHFTQIEAKSALKQIKGFAGAVFSSVPMIIWLLSQIAVFASRAFEITGLFSGITDKALRWKFLFIAAIAVALLIPAVGIGNPRYRAPAEPVLILFLVQGLHAAFSRAGWLIARVRNFPSPSG